MSEQKAAIERNGEATLLVVDDEPEIVALLDEYFTGLGYRVLTAEDGATALKRAEQSPDLIVLDEPTSFLDIRYKLELLTVLKRMVRENDLAVLLSLHELELAERISDTVVCVAGDRIDRIGPPEEIFTRAYIAKLYKMEHGKYDPCFDSLEFVP